jgi:CheY-like chemotaxis protein
MSDSQQINHILLVEDHADWRRRLKALLKSCSFRVGTVKTREAALSYLALNPEVEPESGVKRGPGSCPDALLELF